MTQPDPSATDTTTTDDKGKQAGDDLTAEVAKWKKLSRENEAKAKANADAAQRLEQIEAEKKTAEERATEKATQAEARAAAAELEATRLRVAFEKGLTPAQAKRLAGTTQAELEADADEVLRDFPVRPPDEQRKGPKPDGSQGSKGDRPTGGADEGKAEAERRFGPKK